MDEFRTKHKLELENIFVKKYKLTSEHVSTCSFNEKENEEYYQHHVHTYALKNRIIDFVNDDCLAEIFMYVPICERPKISSVSQKWKRVLEYSWGNVKKLELTYWKYDEEPTWLQNYQTTLDGQLSFLKSLLSKCGHYLTLLDLSAYSHCNIVHVVNKCCPNLVELRLRFAFIDDEMLSDAFSRLSKLKVLKITFEEFKDEAIIPSTLIYSLRNVAATLTDLILCHLSDDFKYIKFPKVFISVLRDLKALNKFEVYGIKTFKEHYWHIIKNVEEYASHGSYFPELETNQLRDIQQLILKSYIMTDDALYTIANTLKKLVDLRIVWIRITNAGIVAISKMNLQTLKLYGYNDFADYSSMKLLKGMITLKIHHNNNITDDLAIKLLEKSPHMERFYVLNLTVTIELIKKAEEISRKRNRHLTVGVLFKCDEKKYESPYFKVNASSKIKRIKLE